MRRLFLLFVILAMCAVVIVGGNITFVNSNSILKQPVAKKVSYRIIIDFTENKLFVLDNEKVVKSYKVSLRRQEASSPIGYWKIVKKDLWNKGLGGYWLGLNIPWDNYGIQGKTEPQKVENLATHECIKMLNSDIKEIYNMVEIGTLVTIYGGQYGSAGRGYRSIHPGDRGADVYTIQKMLKEQGYFNGTLNGIYDENMKVAVHKFQSKKGLKVTDALGQSFYIKLGIVFME